MRKLLTLVALSAAFLPPAHAQEQKGVDGFVAGDFRLSSDYIWRGLSLTNGNVAVSHSLSYNFEIGAYLGYWASNVELVNEESVFDTGIEVDVFAGYKAAFDEEGRYGLDFGIQHYYFDVENNYNHNELYLNIIFTDFAVSYYRSTDIAENNYYELSWSSELGEDGLTTLSASVGYTQFEGRIRPSQNQTDQQMMTAPPPPKDYATFNYLVSLSFYFGTIGDFTIAYSGVTSDVTEYGYASVARNGEAAGNTLFFSWGISF